MRKILGFAGIALLTAMSCSRVETPVMDLSGEWSYRLDTAEIGLQEKWFTENFTDKIQLPGALRDYEIGKEPTLKTDWTGSIYDSSWYFNPALEKYRKAGDIKFPFWLTPVKHFRGMAWYQREIETPAKWQGKEFTLTLERPHWQTRVWVDTIFVGSGNSLSVPHRFTFSADKVGPGKHKLTVLVDNDIRDIDPGINSHSISDHTQGNWNGMVGNITLEETSTNYIQRVKLIPQLKTKTLLAEIHLATSSAPYPDQLKIDIAGLNHSHNMSGLMFPIQEKDTLVKLEIPMGDDMRTWSEFAPNVYQFSVKTMVQNSEMDQQTEVFGMREFTLDSLHFAINDTTVFLRGTTECSVFPLTGYPPTDEAEWDRIFSICKDFGLNHMRFHSYCPPEAAFSAADKAGFYLQVEGPSWAKYSTGLGYGKPIDQYLMDETKRILDEYGNHPSFVMMAYGNEPSGRYVGYLEKWVDHFRQYDSRFVYTGASTGRSWSIIENSDFIVRSPPRGLKWDKDQPESEFDYRNNTEGQNRPYVTFEMGQWCVFPNFKEIDKYTGSLKAKNFEMFREDLADKGMANFADSFLMASGKMQASCYKQEIEATLRTPNLAGFQLLSLNDFSGQGTALVGVLDAFWDEKGYIGANEFSQFCNEVVPLVRLPKYTFKSTNKLEGTIEIANFSGAVIPSAKVKWMLVDKAGETVYEHVFRDKEIPLGQNHLYGKIQLPLNFVKEASQLKLTVSANGYQNSWNIWVYPEEKKQTSDKVYICKELDAKAEKILNSGGKVLLMAAGKVENGKDVVHYQIPVFWNTSWFRMRPPHTTGMLIRNQHPVFKHFPTDYYSDQQWWEVSNRAQCMNLQNFPAGFTPAVQPIDTWFLNRKLAMLFEAKVDKGKLVVCSMDLDSDLDNRIVAKRLYNGILEYMESDQFQPKTDVKLATIKELFEKKDRPVWKSYVHGSPE